MLRAEWDAGVIASTIANVNRAADTPTFSPTDFTLHFTPISASSEPISLQEAMATWD
ncbi:phage tail assembly protein T [Pantoea dispersa]